MAVSDDQIAYVKDLFRDLPALTTRKMFGGLGIYSEEVIFAVIGPEDALLIKAKGALAQRLLDEGSSQWTAESKQGTLSRMPYWTLPEAALDDPDEACRWARLSFAEEASS